MLGTATFQNGVKEGHNVTVQGQNIKLVVDGDRLEVGDSTDTHANVVLTDLPNRNGVIQVIDKVLIPAD